MSIGQNVTIHYGAEFRYPYKIIIGNGSIIGDNCILDGRSGLTILENVNLSSNVGIYTLQHDVNDCDFSGKGAPVLIKNRAWISSNTIVLPGITVGEGAVLAAGAIATKNIDDYCIYAGIPAHKIGERNRDLRYCFSKTDSTFFL